MKVVALRGLIVALLIPLIGYSQEKTIPNGTDGLELKVPPKDSAKRKFKFSFPVAGDG